MKKKLSALITLMFLTITIITSIPAYADDYKYIPPTAPENWKEMSYEERLSYLESFVGDRNSEEGNAWFKRIQNAFGKYSFTLVRKDDLVVLNSPNVGDNINFLQWFNKDLESHPNYKTWQSLGVYIVYYDYDLLYQISEGIKTLSDADVYENFPIYNPDYTPPETLKSREEILSVLSSSDNTDNTGDNTGNEGGDNSDNNDGNNNDSGGNNDNENINIDTNVEGCNCGSALNEIYKRLGEVKDILAENSDRYNQYEHNIDDIYKAISENGYQKKSLEATENIMVALYDIKAFLETGSVSDNAISDNKADDKGKEVKAYEEIIKTISENSRLGIQAISENRRDTVSLLEMAVELNKGVEKTNSVLYALGLGLVFLVGIKIVEIIIRYLPHD